MIVKYTDIDYVVFTDGARFVTEGRSPYERMTYRYTPLLAMALAPNIWFSPLFGKLLFVGCDLLVGLILLKILDIGSGGRFDSKKNERSSSNHHEEGEEKQKKNRKKKKRLNENHQKRRGRRSEDERGKEDEEGNSEEEEQEERERERESSTRWVFFPRGFVPVEHLKWVSFGWLLNPVVINVSTRGNAESLICLLVVLTLYFLVKKQNSEQQKERGEKSGIQALDLSALFFGISVHFKIYPVIYTLAFVLFLTKRRYGQAYQNLSFLQKCIRLINRDTLRFAVVSLSTFLVLTLAMYAVYGYEFLDQTYFYHVYRSDHRHNLSLYFYHLYLTSTGAGASLPIAVGMFLPQVLLLIVVSWIYSDARQLPFALLLLTVSFVTFNKVCTVQYFVWYFALFPLILPTTRLSARSALFLLLLWLGSQFVWFAFGYLLEFQGLNTFLFLWIAGVGFFAANIYAMYFLIRNQI